MIQAEGRATFGPLLRRERELRNWSQQELIRRILDLCAQNKEYPALDPKTVGRWERGEHKPSLYYRKRLCQVFGKNPIQLGFLE
jgi:transcriptional regulator with XRE-family HTH domain